MWVISQSNWPVWTALTGMTFVKKITSQFIQQLRCSGESYFKNELKSLNPKYSSYSVKTLVAVFGWKMIENNNKQKWLSGFDSNNGESLSMTKVGMLIVSLRGVYANFRLIKGVQNG